MARQGDATAKRIGALVTVGNAIVDAGFRSDFFTNGPLAAATAAGIDLVAEDTQELSQLEASWQAPDGPAAKDALHAEMTAASGLLGCPKRPCPRSVASGGLRVLALLANACVDENFREQFLSNTREVSLRYFRESLTAEDLGELDALQSLPQADKDDLGEHEANIMTLMMRCPMGCISALDS